MKLNPSALTMSAFMLLSALTSVPAAAQSWFAGGGDTDADVSGFGQVVNPPRNVVNGAGAAPIAAVRSATPAEVVSGSGAVRALGQTSALPAIGGLHLSAYSFAQVSNGDPLSGELALSVADATAQFSDFFRLAVPGYAVGTLFTVTAHVRIDATAIASGSVSNAAPSSFEASAFWTSTVSLTPSIGGAQLANQTDSLSCGQNQGGSVCTGSGAGWRTVTFQMPNQSWQAQLQILGRARTTTQVFLAGGGQALATGSAELGHTIAWEGISALVDPSGATVSTFSAISATSGFDYRNAYVSAVPEPTPALLLLAGLVAMGWMRRRRSQ